MLEIMRKICFYSVAVPMMIAITPMVALMALMDRPKSYPEFKKNMLSMMDWSSD